MKSPLSWEEYFMTLAIVASLKSKDQSTQVGAVIVDNHTRKVISAGYNGFPRYMDDSKVPQTRPEKYLYVVHAELNAILHAERSLDNCTLYVSVFPCSECMKAVIQSGIKTVIYLNELSGDDWEKSKEATLKLAELAGITIRKFNGKNEIIDYLQTKVNIRK
ncbi:MAG: dCMP deaminase family protein [candidate division Zixibacteria bacterium]|jgi:dCMP deaminase|nr:dCMP deaminase family protein [candidate division Zixibacteria bacterium]